MNLRKKRKALFVFGNGLYSGKRNKNKYTSEKKKKKKKRRKTNDESKNGGECERRHRVPIYGEDCNLRIHVVHIILLHQMASLFKARFLKGI